MPKKSLPLESFRLQNFKAVRDSGTVEFTPFTVLIGANGSGKSSLLEGLEVFHSLGTSDVDTIFNEPRWRGFHHVWNKATTPPHEEDEDATPPEKSPMAFEAVINRQMFASSRHYDVRVEITQAEDGEVMICSERVNRHGELFQRNASGKITREETSIRKLAKTLTVRSSLKARTSKPLAILRRLDPGISILSSGLIKPFGEWQFLNMNAGVMGQPTVRLGGRSNSLLEANASNLAEVVRKLSADGLDQLVEGLQQVLGYARDLQVDQFSPVDRTVYLKLREQDFEVPGWLLSGGTVRIIAILACLYRDEPPPLLVIEEIENGLDPRTVGFLVSQMRDAIEHGKTQIILTSHSPYFLSQTSLEHLLLCQRTTEGEPRFWRPANSQELRKWSEDFNPGELFASGRMQRAMKKAIEET